MIPIKKIFHETEGISLANGEVELFISLEFGPRILFYGYSSYSNDKSNGESNKGDKEKFRHGQNFFRVFNEDIESFKTEKELSSFKNYGGHRFWIAPEDFERTYAADNQTVSTHWNKEKQILTLETPTETVARVKKVLEIKLATEGTQVEINHRVSNHNPWNVTMAAWGISVMAEGGTAFIPQEELIPHSDKITPSRPIVLWSYTKMNDPRLVWEEDYIAIKQDNQYQDPVKIGTLNRREKLAYQLGNEVFIKHHPHIEGATYPDMGCNAEVFTMPYFLEVESLSPLVNVPPYDEISHQETWELKKNIKNSNDAMANIFND